MRDFSLLFNNDLLNVSFAEDCPRCWELLALFAFLFRCSDHNVRRTIGEDQKVRWGVSQHPQSQVKASLFDTGLPAGGQAMLCTSNIVFRSVGLQRSPLCVR